MRSINSLTLSGIMKIISTAESIIVPMYRKGKGGLNVVVIMGYHCHQLHRKVYPHPSQKVKSTY
jgi:hypothetical protein